MCTYKNEKEKKNNKAKWAKTQKKFTSIQLIYQNRFERIWKQKLYFNDSFFLLLYAFISKTYLIERKKKC